MPARVSALLLMITLIAAAGGCATGIRGGKKYTRFAPDGCDVIEPARHSAAACGLPVAASGSPKMIDAPGSGSFHGGSRTGC
jgi:hypothetical protein